MKLIRVNNELLPDGTNARMKLVLQRIEETEDRKKLRVLNLEYWRLWFKQRKVA